MFVSHFNSNINMQYSWYHIPFLECHLILTSSLKLLATNSLKFRGASLRKGCRVKFSGSVDFHVKHYKMLFSGQFDKCKFNSSQSSWRNSFTLHGSTFPAARLEVMLNVMEMHCNTLHAFKLVLVMCNATSNGNVMHLKKIFLFD